VRALFDVNVLLALFDTGHVHHSRSRTWWDANHHLGWASCPLTQNGFLRIISQRHYPRPLTLRQATQVLHAQVSLPGHAFWPDDLSLTDAEVFDRDRLIVSDQITDVYLLALAAKNGGRFVTFDHGIAHSAARKADASQLLIL
jgi:toxin-antitoxin system PIN domain toxin